jgi:hypothetical protein
VTHFELDDEMVDSPSSIVESYFARMRSGDLAGLDLFRADAKL